MKLLNASAVVAAVVASLLSVSAQAADKAPKSVLPESARAAPAGRGVSVVVAQAELGDSINPSYVMAAMGGGVLGVLIDAKIGSDRAKRAEAGITPIRYALIDVDADQLALDTTKAVQDSAPWLSSRPADFTRDPTLAAKSARLDAAAEGQVAFFEYVYDTPSDFSAIRVGVRIIFADKTAAAGAPPEARLKSRNLVYDGTVTSVVQLPAVGTPAENARRWADNDGALAKLALATAFSDLGKLIPRALSLTADEVKAMQAAPVKSIGIYRGNLQQEDAGGALLFNGGLVHVQSLQE